MAGKAGKHGAMISQEIQNTFDESELRIRVKNRHLVWIAIREATRRVLAQRIRDFAILEVYGRGSRSNASTSSTTVPCM